MDPRRLLKPTLTLAATGSLLAGCAMQPGLNDDGPLPGAAPEAAVIAPQVLDAVAEAAAPVESATAVPYFSVASRTAAEDQPPSGVGGGADADRAGRDRPRQPGGACVVPCG